MTNVYKIEVVVVDYDDVGEHGITRLIGTLRTSYNVLSYITNIHKAWVDDPDTVGRKLLIQHKLPELFSPWLPITTAPRDGTRFLLWYALERRPYVVYWETDSDPDDPYIVVDSPSDHKYRNCIDPSKLEGSYWQPLQTPPQL